MPFIGNQPAESYSAFQKQDFTTSATTSYTLDNPVTNANELALFINFVRQEPTTAYTASGTSLTLTSATSASDDMYCVFLGKAVQTVNPPNSSVGNSQLDVSAINSQTAETSIAGGDEVLIYDTSASALRKMTRTNFVSGVGGDNTPAFMAYLSSSQSIPNTTGTKLIFQTEVFDTDSAYNTSDGLFTVPTSEAGKYCFNFATRLTNWNLASQAQIFIRVNGSTDKLLNESGDRDGDNNTFMSCGIINLSVGDTVGVYFYQDGGNGASLRTGEQNSYFSGYKLIGV